MRLAGGTRIRGPQLQVLDGYFLNLGCVAPIAIRIGSIAAFLI